MIIFFNESVLKIYVKQEKFWIELILSNVRIKGNLRANTGRGFTGEIMIFLQSYWRQSEAPLIWKEH